MTVLFFIVPGEVNRQQICRFVVRYVAHLNKTTKEQWAWLIHGQIFKGFVDPTKHTLKLFCTEMETYFDQNFEKESSINIISVLKKISLKKKEERRCVFIPRIPMSFDFFSITSFCKKENISISFFGSTQPNSIPRIISFLSFKKLLSSLNAKTEKPSIPVIFFIDEERIETDLRLLCGKNFFFEEKMFVKRKENVLKHEYLSLIAWEEGNSFFYSKYTGKIKNTYLHTETENSTFLFFFPYSKAEYVPVLTIAIIPRTNFGFEVSRKKIEELVFMKKTFSLEKEEYFYTAIENMTMDFLKRLDGNSFVDFITNELDMLMNSSPVSVDIRGLECRFAVILEMLFRSVLKKTENVCSLIDTFPILYSTGCVPSQHFCHFVFQKHKNGKKERTNSELLFSMFWEKISGTEEKIKKKKINFSKEDETTPFKIQRIPSLVESPLERNRVSVSNTPPPRKCLKIILETPNNTDTEEDPCEGE